MYKKFLLFVFVTATLTLTQFAAADYTLINSRTETVYAAYATWQPWEPAGWRTWGWYEIKPNATKTLENPQDGEWVYIYVEGEESEEIKPSDHAIRENSSLLIHPWKPFSVLQTAGGDFIRSNRAQWSLERAEFYKYPNGGSHTIRNLQQQGGSLASQVFNKHSKTLQRKDIQAVLPSVFESLKDPETQRVLNPSTINLVISDPNLLRQFVPDIDPKFVNLLKTDAQVRRMLRDPQVQTLFQKPAAIDELAGLLRIGEPVVEVGPQLPPTTPQNLPDLPAREIYNQAMSSVVWIETFDNDNYLGKGSGVLIDKDRRLVVTNAHVIEGATDIYVFFPWKNQNGDLNGEEDFYLENWGWLENLRYASEARVISQDVRNDVAIIRLDQLSPVAREIKHDFSKNVEDSLKEGDKVHVLGNPGDRLWDWGQGTFLSSWSDCPPNKGDCLELEANVHGGNSGGPVLNGQGILVGIITATDKKTSGLAAPARNIKVLLNTVPVNLGTIPPPQQTYPKRVFKIRNNTGVTVPYQVKWSNNDSWKQFSLRTGFIRTHTSNGQNVPSGYPKIRFDYIADDNGVTYRQYTLETALFRENNNDNAPTRRFQYNWSGDRLDLVRDTGAASSQQTYPKRVFKIRNNTGVTVRYQIRWSSNNNWQSYSLETGFVRTHRSSGQNIPSGYPIIRFDHIADDQEVTYRTYNLDTALFRDGNNNHAPTYSFRYNRWGDRLDLLRDVNAAPTLSKKVPKENALLSNYPNPFNPETWIPYKLAKPAEVTVTIHAADGRLIRTLALGHQPAGVYQSKNRAAYWDGKNELGESVASGVYFYTLKAGDFTATRKMLIRK